jgi:hypothetical protein
LLLPLIGWQESLHEHVSIPQVFPIAPAKVLHASPEPHMLTDWQ